MVSSESEMQNPNDPNDPNDPTIYKMDPLHFGKNAITIYSIDFYAYNIMQVCAALVWRVACTVILYY